MKNKTQEVASSTMILLLTGVRISSALLTSKLTQMILSLTLASVAIML